MKFGSKLKLLPSLAVTFVVIVCLSASGQTFVPDLDGKTYQRSAEHLAMTIHQSGSRITARFDSSGFEHELVGDWDANQGAFDCKVARRNKATGCLTEFYLLIRVVGKYQIDEQAYGSDGRCDLPTDFKEHYQWSLQ